MEQTARIYAIAYQARFWFDLLLMIVALVLVATAPRARDKTWLLVMLIALTLVPVAWHAFNFLQNLRGTQPSDSAAVVSAVLLNLFSLVSTVTIVAFAFVWRSKPSSSAGSDTP